MEAPLDDLVRAVTSTPEVRADEPADGTLGVLAGQYTVHDTWTRIRSWYEGDFYERIAPGAAKRTIDAHFGSTEGRIQVLFDHGHDPQIGNKVLGPIRSLADTDAGVDYEVDLLDTSYNRDLLPGLAADLYGASFRFSVVREEWNDDPGASEHNPEGLPERTILEYKMPEFGPVTFPAYPGASAGMRSLTDRYIERHYDPERVAELRAEATHRTSTTEPANPTDDPPSRHSTDNTTLMRARLRLLTV